MCLFKLIVWVTQTVNLLFEWHRLLRNEEINNAFLRKKEEKTGVGGGDLVQQDKHAVSPWLWVRSIWSSAEKDQEHIPSPWVCSEVFGCRLPGGILCDWICWGGYQGTTALCAAFSWLSISLTKFWFCNQRQVGYSTISLLLQLWLTFPSDCFYVRTHCLHFYENKMFGEGRWGMGLWGQVMVCVDVCVQSSCIDLW